MGYGQKFLGKSLSMRLVRLAVVNFTVIYGPGQCPDVAVNPEARFLVRLLLVKLLRIRRHSAPPKRVYPVAAFDRNQKFRLSGRR